MSGVQLFKNRTDAGLQLTESLKKFSLNANVIILALPRGGVPVAHQISKTLHIPYEVLIVRKLGHPLHEEYGIGAITENGFYWLNPQASGVDSIPQEKIQSLVEKEKKEIKRRISLYRHERPLPDLKNKTVILVDDGLATGVTARVGARFVRSLGAKKVILAVPVGSVDTISEISEDFDKIICPHQITNFMAVGHHYWDFEQVSDEEVLQILSPNSNWKKSLKSLSTAKDLHEIIEKIKDSRIVMLGESSHGTQEFYEWRRWISQELIVNHGFNFIAVEGDWPACEELNCFIHSQSPTLSARSALRHFRRWPTWMWANTEILKFTEWLKSYNDKNSTDNRVGFHGLDVYSFFESMDEVIRLLEKIEPELAAITKKNYECFNAFFRDERSYAKSLYHFPEGCQEQVVETLARVLHMRLNKSTHRQALFDLQQNARIVKNAENYYRTMIHGDEDSWNVRDRHMMETLNHLLERYGSNSKAIIWAHNTHIGDYRATDMLKEGQVNIGGLAREQWGEDEVSLIGFGTYEGEVIASEAWDGPVQVMPVPSGLPGSYEELFHETCDELELKSAFIWLKDKDIKHGDLQKIRGHRAIGVVYHPAYERHGNYVPTSLSSRYDGFIFIDETHALTPLLQKFDRKELPETWPRGV